MDCRLNILAHGAVLKCRMKREGFPGVPLAGSHPGVSMGLAHHHKSASGGCFCKTWMPGATESLIFPCVVAWSLCSKFSLKLYTIMIASSPSVFAPWMHSPAAQGNAWTDWGHLEFLEEQQSWLEGEFPAAKTILVFQFHFHQTGAIFPDIRLDFILPTIQRLSVLLPLNFNFQKCDL